MESTPRNRGILMAAVVGLFALFAVVAWMQRPTPQPYQPKPLIQIHATDLDRAYEANEIAANQNYSGASLRVLGVVEAIATDRNGVPYVDLKGERYRAVRANFTTGVQGVSELTKGQRVAVQCICVGKGGPVVHLKDCTLD